MKQVPLSIRSLARNLDCSHTTVSLALKGDPRIKQPTRLRIQQMAQQLGYRMNPLLSEMMSSIRRSQPHSFQGKLAMVDVHPEHPAGWNRPGLAECVGGAEARARDLGFGFDHFRFHDRNDSARPWLRMFRARGIRGVLLMGFTDPIRIPPWFEQVRQQVPCVIAGAAADACDLPYVNVDHFQTVAIALKRIRSLGYQRPGLILTVAADQSSRRKLSASFLANRTSSSAEIPVLLVEDLDNFDPDVLSSWQGIHGPDVVLSPHSSVRARLRPYDYQIPYNVGFVLLDVPAENHETVGVNLNRDRVGEAAVDLLLQCIRDRSQGRTAFSSGMLVGASWCDDDTAKPSPILGAPFSIVPSAKSPRWLAQSGHL